MEPRVLAGGVKTVENGRVDRVFEIVRPRFSGRWGNISLYVRRWLDLCGGAPYGWFLLFYRGGLVLCSLMGGWRGWG